MKFKYVKNNILILFLVAVILLLGIFVSFTSTNWFKQRQIEDSVKHEILKIQRLLPFMMDSEALLLAGQLDFLLADQHLQEAWAAKDRASLMRVAKPMFENMYAKYRITHLYFIDTSSSCFLRVHNPSRYGDTIDRDTLDKAIRFGNLSYGMELGVFGTFTLRVVHPWYINKQLEGYVELGMDFDHIMAKIKAILGVELIFTINKNMLDRREWEEGLKMMGRTGDWDLLSDRVIMDKTLGEIPAGLVSSISDSLEEKRGTMLKIKIAGLDYRGGRINLKDSSGNYVGDIIFLKDVTELESAWFILLLIQVLSSSLMYLLLLYIITTFGMGVAAREMIHTVDNRLKLLKPKKRPLQEQGDTQNDVFQPGDNPSATISADTIKRYSADAKSVLSSKQFGLFEIMRQGEKTYEEIFELAQSKNLDISNIEALRVQIFRLNKKLEQETLFKIDRTRRNGILFFNISSVSQDTI